MKFLTYRVWRWKLRSLSNEYGRENRMLCNEGEQSSSGDSRLQTRYVIKS